MDQRGEKKKRGGSFMKAKENLLNPLLWMGNREINYWANGREQRASKRRGE